MPPPRRKTFPSIIANITRWFRTRKLAIETQSHQKRINSALHKSRHCFTDDAAKRIRSAYPSYGISPIIEQILARPQLTMDSPKSFADLSANLDQLFNAQFLDHLKKKSASFDGLCGAPLSDAFLGQKTYLQWAELIAENCIMSFLAPPSSFVMSQFDGTSDTIGSSSKSSYGTSPPRPAPSPQPAPITQIKLRGPTIKEAWANSPEVDRISAFERLQLSDWSPAARTGAQVFHGTSIHLKSKALEEAMIRALDTLPTTLSKQPGLTQLYPSSDKYSGIYTSFSAIRSFLWAVFMAEVIDDPPGPTQSERLAKPFQMRGRSYEGVLLVRFHSTQPAPAGLTSHVIPSGKEGSWQSAARQCSGLPGVVNFWERVNHIHGQSTLVFPDVIHGRDLPSLRTSMAAFPGKSKLLWQTAWMSDNAARSLNGSTEEIFAISFELVSRPEQAGQPLKKRKIVGNFVRKTSDSIKKKLF